VAVGGWCGGAGVVEGYGGVVSVYGLGGVRCIGCVFFFLDGGRCGE